MSALEIMQVCLIYFKDKAQQPEDREKAEDYLGKIECKRPNLGPARIWLR